MPIFELADELYELPSRLSTAFYRMKASRHSRLSWVSSASKARGKPPRSQLGPNPILLQLPGQRSFTDLPCAQHSNHRKIGKLSLEQLKMMGT